MLHLHQARLTYQKLLFALDTMPDGRFVISHDLDMGMVSFLDPLSLELKTVDGFALEGILEEATLSRRNEEE